MDAWIASGVSLVLGAALSLIVALIVQGRADTKQAERDRTADRARRASESRDHAARALDVVRPALDALAARTVGVDGVDLSDLPLETATNECELISDPVLRPMLMAAVSQLRNPRLHMLPDDPRKSPENLQLEAVVRLRSALATLVREESMDPRESEGLALMAEAANAALRARMTFLSGG